MIVVNDNSTDETVNVARKLGAKVISLDGLPEGWSGKTYACHRGAEAATGDWLLFTDADTVHDPYGPACVVAYAESEGLDGLSLFIRQSTSGTVDSVALPVAFAGLFVGLSVGDAVLNGQYILLSRNTYTRSGGFATVAGEILEDIALGRYLAVSGYHVPLLRSDGVAFVRMYADGSALWQGLVRLGAGSLRWFGVRAILTAIFVTGVMAPILVLVTTVWQRRNRRWAVVSWVAVAASFVPWARRFGAVWAALLAPVGALLLQSAAVWGLISRLVGRDIPWKGRRL